MTLELLLHLRRIRQLVTRTTIGKYLVPLHKIAAGRGKTANERWSHFQIGLYYLFGRFLVKVVQKRRTLYALTDSWPVAAPPKCTRTPDSTS